MVTLERLVGLRSASLATPKEIAAIDAMHATLVALHRDGSRAAYFSMNQQIHAEIARLAGNPVLQNDMGGSDSQNPAGQVACQLRRQALGRVDQRARTFHGAIAGGRS